MKIRIPNMSLKTGSFLMFFGFMLTLNMNAQTLHLTAVGITEKETQTIDSLYYNRSFKDFSSLQTEVNTIKSQLTNFGYIESELLGLTKENDSSFLATYQLNQRYKSIRLFFDASLNKNILKSVSTNIQDNYVDIEIEKLEQTLKLLNSEISNLGDPFSTLQLINIKKTDQKQMTADLVVSQQTQRSIDSIIIKGYEKFPKSYVKHYLKIKKKQPFNLQTIKDKTLDFENLSFANQIKEPEVLFTKDSTLLYIYVEKEKSNSFDGFLGFGTNAESSKIEFNGYLNLNLINNLNYGESFRLLYKSDESEQKTFDVKARLPYLFGSPLGSEVGLNIFRKDSTFVTVSQSVKLEYQINSKNLVSAGINATTSTNLLENEILLVDDYKSVFYTLDYLFIIRQRFDALFPINFQFDISTGLGYRTFEKSKELQTKLALNTFKIFNLNDRNSVYLKLNSALLLSDNYFENELFRFGGINSIRGFEENSLTANLYALLNTEYRYKVSTSLYIHSVLDATYYENNLVNSKGKLFGFGFGFGLLTQAGLFKLTYSAGKLENQPFKLSNSKVHLSLTASF